MSDSGCNHRACSNGPFQQDWGLDPNGNWGAFKEDSDGNGTWDIDQTRTANEVNEITDITSTPTWDDPVYDTNGNMTTLPQPAY